MIEKLQHLKNFSFEERLLKVISEFHYKEILFTTSFSLEDQIITHILAKHNININIYTIDTGRHFQETYTVQNETIKRYANITIKTVFPRTEGVEQFVNTHGINGFYNSVTNRKACCWVRKVEPLNRILAKGYKLWINGIRAEHSKTRFTSAWIEFETTKNLIKFNPVFELTTQEVEEHVKYHNVPYNSLYDEGYTSIGCAPCTRPRTIGGDFRSGRWWWEDSSHNECGLHLKTNNQ